MAEQYGMPRYCEHCGIKVIEHKDIFDCSRCGERSLCGSCVDEDGECSICLTYDTENEVFDF